MKISEQRIKAMVIMNIIDNCTMELDNAGQERYSLNEDQFGKVVDTLVKNIKVIQCCEGEAAQLPPNPITDKEHKDLMKALYPKDKSKRFRR